MGKFRNRTAVLAACAFAIVYLAGCGPVKDSAVAATVGEEKITAGVLNFFARFQQATYETYYAPMMGTTGEQMWARSIDGKNTYEETAKDGILESLENMYIIRQHAKEYGAELTDEEKKAIDTAAADFVKANEKDGITAVSGSLDNIKEVLNLLTVQEKMREHMTAGADVEVSDEEAAQKTMQYVILRFTKTDKDGKQTEATDGEKAAMRDLLQDMLDLVSSKEAEDLKAAAEITGVKADSPPPFEIDVKTASFDASSTYPDEGLIKAADALKNEGDVTELIEDETKVGAACLTSLMDRKATDEKKESIISERKNKAYTELLDKWREETKIDVKKDVWKKIDFKKLGVKIKQNPPKEDSSEGEIRDKLRMAFI